MSRRKSRYRKPIHIVTEDRKDFIRRERETSLISFILRWLIPFTMILLGISFWNIGKVFGDPTLSGYPQSFILIGIIWIGLSVYFKLYKKNKWPFNRSFQRRKNERGYRRNNSKKILYLIIFVLVAIIIFILFKPFDNLDINKLKNLISSPHDSERMCFSLCQLECEQKNQNLNSSSLITEGLCRCLCNNGEEFLQGYTTN